VRVSPGQAVRVERLPGAVGDRVELAEVLLVGGEGDTRVGQPVVAGARVVGTITAQGRGRKITIFKQKRRKNYRRKQGHRQEYTELRVEAIEG
jgi:large subunit ribosomal protein L21